MNWKTCLAPTRPHARARGADGAPMMHACILRATHFGDHLDADAFDDLRQQDRDRIILAPTLDDLAEQAAAFMAGW